jgi:thioredoxin 1
MNRFKLIIGTVVLFTLSACNSTESLSPVDFQEGIMADKEAIVLDVRSPEEFSMGHLANSKNVHLHSRDFEDAASEIIGDAPVYVYCKSGSRSSEAAIRLSEMGFEVYDLEGGLMNWEASGYGLEGVRTVKSNKYSLAEYQAFIDTNQLVLVDFYADWCGPCKAMAPHIKSVKESYQDKLTILKVDTDKSPAISRHFNITGIPLVKLYHNGEEVYDKTGYHSKEQLEDVLKSYL